MNIDFSTVFSLKRQTTRDIAPLRQLTFIIFHSSLKIVICGKQWEKLAREAEKEWIAVIKPKEGSSFPHREGCDVKEEKRKRDIFAVEMN